MTIYNDWFVLLVSYYLIHKLTELIDLVCGETISSSVDIKISQNTSLQPNTSAVNMLKY